MEKEIFELQFGGWGTNIDVQIVAQGNNLQEKARNDLNGIRDLYSKYEKIFSRFDKESELSKLNSNIGVFQKASPEIIEIAKKCLKYNKETNGFFDPRIMDNLERAGYVKNFYENDFEKTVSEKGFKKIEKDLSDDLKIENGKIFFGSRMDFSGIVKGWATDRAAEFALSRGWKNFFVDSGGDMYFSGVDEKENKWTVDVEGIDFEKIMFEFSNRAVATSGIGKRKWEISGKRRHHIINPSDPDKFSFEINSVTAISDLVEEADVWSKTLFLMGKEEGMEYAEKNKIGCVFLDYRGNARISKEAKKFLFRI